MQLERSNEVNSDINRLYDSALKENKRLQDENQIISSDVAKYNSENIGLLERLETIKIEYHQVF